jgi:uncharacterized zinc-type alcohol dehydrogenase-like protein
MATILNGTGTLALAAFDKTASLKKHEFGRPAPGPNDVAVDIKYCGMCHSDLHACNGEWGVECFPIAPGHEISGLVKEVGSDVTDFKVGDRVGVGVFVDSCRCCDICKQGLEQHCAHAVMTYSTPFPKDKGENFKDCAGSHTNGGYSSDICVNQHFCFKIPDNMLLEYAGPLLCAGITTFSPLNRHVLKKGGFKKVGVVGLGGLGQVAVKIAKAMGSDVTVFSRNTKKLKDAMALGATLMVQTDEEALKAASRTFDVILDTVSHGHPVAPLLSTLKVGGTYVLVGLPSNPIELSALPLVMNRYSIEGTLVGGVSETKEMLAFCAKHDIVPKIHVIHAKDATAQFRALQEGTAGVERAVIDMSTLKELSD